MIAAAIALTTVLAQARDTAPAAASGTASITGAVTTTETPARPVRRAIVTLNSTEPRIGRTTITDDNGRFAFDGLPAGRYTLSATKRGWVTSVYGAKAPGRPGRPIPVAPGQHATASIALPRGAVISGTILDPSGGVPAGVTLRLLRYSYAANSGERRLTPAPGSVTPVDERGQYRIYGLPPGEYYVCVVSSLGPSFISGTDLHLTSDVDVQEALKAVEGGPSTPITDVPQRTVALTPTFYPGTPSPAQATPIVLRAGEERDGVDFAIQFTAASRVEGVVSGPAGGPVPAGTQVSLTPNDPSMPVVGFDAFRSARPGADGHFEFGQVAPGPYLLVARASLPPAPGSSVPQVYSASMDLDVQSDDQRGLSLVLDDTFTVTGVVRFEGDGASPSLKGVRVNLQPAMQGNSVTVTSGGSTVNPDNTFTISGVTPGRYRLGLLNSSPQLSWTTKGAVLGGQDALDSPAEVRQSLSDAVITITDRESELNGTVEAANGGDYTLILFPQDHQFWTAPSRRVITARTSKDGTFTFRHVPPGAYSLAAVDDVEPGEWYDPSFLQRLTPTAIAVTIGEGEKKTQNIRVGGG